MTQQKSILAFGAHPDDIEIGMGGTLKRLVENGQKVVACIATTPNQKKLREKEAKKALSSLGVRDIVFLDMPLTEFGFNRKTIGKLDVVLNKYKPHSIFTHWTGDSHQDHVHLTASILAATRHNNFNVYMYEQTIPGGITDASFRPQLFIDISPRLEDKIRAIKYHASQCAKYGEGWTEGLRGRAMHRGYQIKTKFAEAFEIVKVREDTGLFE